MNYIAKVAFGLSAPALFAFSALAQENPSRTPGLSADQEMSDRTPQKDTSSPASQTTKVDGKTSDRTPSNNPGQQGSSNQGQSTSQQAQNGDSSQQSQRGGANTGRPTAMTQSALKNTLEKAGFKDIQILDAAYLVHARNSDGDVIIMTINPPSLASTASQGGTGSTGSGSGTAGSSSSEQKK